MKITTADLKTLRFTIVVFHEMLDVATDDNEIRNLRMHICRIRKISALLLPAISQGRLDLEDIINKGIPDNSATAKGLRELESDIAIT